MAASLPFPVVISLQSNDIISGGGEKAITMYIHPLLTNKVYSEVSNKRLGRLTYDQIWGKQYVY